MSERLKNFPISFFAVVMGLAGTTIAWHRAEDLLGWTSGISICLLGVSSLIFVGILAVYALKAFRYPEEIRNEFKNITKLSFSPQFL